MEGDLLSFLGSLLLYSFIAFFAYFSRAISPKNGVRILKYGTRKVVTCHTASLQHLHGKSRFQDSSIILLLTREPTPPILSLGTRACVV